MPNSTDPLSQVCFANLRCPQAPTVIEAKAAKVHLGEVVKDLMEDLVVEEQGDFFLYVSFCNFVRLLQGVPFCH